MKIIEKEYDELITNFEVLNLLKHKRKIKGQALLNEFISNVVTYLEKTPAVDETADMAKEAKDICKKYQLTKSETLQVLNMAPTTEVEIHLIVEEAEERIDPLAILEDLKPVLGKASVTKDA